MTTINEADKSNISKKKKNIKKIILFILFLSLLSVISIKKLNTKIGNNQYKKSIAEFKEKNTKELDNKFDLIIDELNNLKDRVIKLENKNLLNEGNIENLLQDFNSIQNQSPQINEKQTNIVITIFKIKEFAGLGIDFSKELNMLISLSKYNANIYDLSIKLLEFKNIKSNYELQKIFSNEKGSIIKNVYDQNKFLKFINNNVRLRKINDISNTNSIDYILLEIENNIKKYDYQHVLDIIEEYKFDTLKETKLNLEYNIKFYNVINEILMLF